ncbi:MAG: carboxypeptidase-like regulatory domain-containing protein [Thermoplasmatota archaeon]
MRFLVAFALTATVLAGCASKAAQEPIDDLGLRATPTTGVIRGLVVDPAIRPIEGVQVVLPASGGAKERSATTNADGLFGFEAVDPGSHFLRVSKPGYADTQHSVQVEAGDSAPPLVKVHLAAVPGAAPYVQSFKFDGFLECALSAVALCSAFNGPTCGMDPVPCTPNATNDNFANVVPIERPPQLVQSEMVWTTTTSASDQLWLWHSRAAKGDGSYNGSCNCWAQGKSPLLMVSNETQAAGNHYGTWHDLYLRVFTGSIEGTRNPLDSAQCYPGDPARPVFEPLGRDPNVYCGGLGYSVEQSFTTYTHVFYGFLPPVGWRFSATPDVPAPQ